MTNSKLLFLLILALLLGGGYSLASATVDIPDNNDAQVGEHQVDGSGFLTGPNDGEPLEIALEYLDKNKGTLGLTSDDLADVVVTDQYSSKHNGVTHIYLLQRYRGIEVFNAYLNINIAADGSVINVGHSFISDLAKAVNTTTPSLSATEAVELAAQELNLNISEPLLLLEEIGGPANEVLLSDGGISLNDIPVKLMYHSPSNQGAEVRLGWNLAIYEKNAQHWWDMRIDALTGRTLDQNDLVISENWDGSSLQEQDTHVASTADPAEGRASSDVSASSLPPEDYRVYPMPAESPAHVSPAPPADGRTLVADPADATASPYGWHDTDGVAGAEYTTTRGNNVHAYEDGNNPGFSPDGGANLVFDFPIDLNQTPDDYEAAAIANLFYWNNVIHDVWYHYGFDEASGNFQENNYGNGGLGSDSVNAEAQDGSGSCNANMLTLPDGQNARMQMYTCNGRDGDLDNGVIVHEYWHGVSIRLTGGPSTSSCLNNSEQGGEGWSDWGGLMMTIEPGDAGTDSRGIGTWLFGQPPTGPGIRPAPYSTDMAINGYTYGDIGSQAVPHGVGFVWATMLWEMNWALIDQHGFDPDFYYGSGGNNIAMQLVIDGLKLQPCSPGFVDARDAILLADQNNNGGANQCLIWEAFAKRGLGYSADQGSSGSTSDGTEAFDMPPSCEGLVVTPPSQDICVGDAASYTVSVGQAFSPPVTMSATGQPAGTNATFSPNPVMSAPSDTTLTIGNTGGATAGNHTITIMGTDGTNTSQTTADLNVFNANPGSITLSQPANGATGVSPLPTFEWSAATQAATYMLEVDDDSTFGSIDYTATVDGTTHTASSAFSPLTTYYWRVRAMNPCGNSSYSAVFNFTTQDIPPILVVDDDDNSADVRAYYTDALDALGQTYDVWDTNNSDNEPSAAELAPYDVVIWFTGDEFGGAAGPGSAGEAALGSWLDSGKCLFMSSEDYHYDRGLTSFMDDYLGVDSVSNDSGNYSSVTGQGSLFGGLGPYALTYPVNDYSDIVSPDGTAELAFNGDNGNGAAVNKDSGVYRTTFFGYPFEAIPDLAGRQETLARFLSWCNSGGSEVPDINVNPTSISVTVSEGDSSTETLTIANLGSGTLNWSISTSSNWLTANPTSGTETVGASTNVTLGIDATSLTAGTYNGTLTITSNDPDEGTVDVPVTLMVVPSGSPDINVNPTNLVVTQAEGQSTTETLTIGNMGTADLTWTIEESPSALQGWSPAALSGGDRNQAVDEVSGRAPVSSEQQTTSESHQPYLPQAVLYDNGPLVNSPGTGSGGADESMVQNSSLGMTTFGLGHQTSAGNRIADDFTVDHPGGWTIDRITFYAYQTGSSTASTITAVNLQIWDGPPNDPSSQVVFGDTTTNRLINSTWSSIYRVAESTSGDTTRPIMANTVSVGLYLPPGTYWLDWQSDGSLTSGPWGPPITINGQSTTGNALQYLGSWGSALDSGTSTQQDFPFIIEGDSAGCTVGDIPWATVSPANGTTPGGSSTPAQVTFDSTGLATDTYTGTLCINSNDPDESLVEIPVELTVLPPGSPDIDVNPTSISVTVDEGDSTSETLTIGNVGSGTLNWNISTSADNDVVGEWTVFYDWGCTGSPGSAIVTFYEDFTFTTSDGYEGTWVLSDDEIVFTFTSGTEYTGTVDGDSMAGTMISYTGSTGCWTAERVTSMSGYVTLESGEHTTSGDRAEEPGATTEYFVNRSDWLTFNPSSGTEAAGASTDVTVGIDATSLTVGTYNDTLTITSNDPDEATVEVPVIVTVQQPDAPAVISDVRTTNVRDVALTVSWLTDVAASGQVHYGTDPNNLNRTGEDVRGASTSDDTHYVLLENLSPNTTYYFDVVSGSTTDDNGGSHYSVTTGPTLGVPGSDTIYGQVRKSDGTTPAAGSVVYITLKDGNNSGTSGQAAALSALVDNGGNWNTNLGNARTEDLSAYFNYSSSGDQLFLEAQGAADGEGCQRVDTSADTPAAIIELGNSPCTISWDIDLQLGWNKIALPIELTNPMTAEEVCDEITSQGGDIAEIDRWNAGGWEGHICGLTFNNFTLEMNTGYFIKSNAVSTWGIEGLPVSSTTLDLQIGWNSISVPHTDGYTAETLCDEIIAQGVTAVEIDSWQAGGWTGHICGLTFNDFNIERGKGYFVKTTSAGTVTPLAVASRVRQPEEVEEVPSDVGQAMPVRNLVVSNLRDTSVTLSWTTEEATTGYVRVGDQVVVDIRGANTSSRTHYVMLQDLSPETTYDIEIISGAETAANMGQVETITTAPTLDSIPQPDTIFGLSYQVDGVTPATGALVYVTVQDANGVGSEGKAKVLSALVDEQGYWEANLGNARTTELDAYFNYSPQGDQVHFDVQGTDGRTGTRTVDTANDTQTPDIIVNFSPTAVEVASVEIVPTSTPWQGGVLLVTFLLAAAGWWYRKK